MNPLYRTDFSLVIPDNSPEGELVTEVDFNEAFGPIWNAYPWAMRRETLENILQTMAENIEGGKDSKIYIRTRAFFVLFDLDKENQPESLLNKMRETYPFIEYARSIYVFDPMAAPREMILIREYMEEYAGVNVMELAYSEYCAIVDLLKENGVSDAEIESYMPELPLYSEAPTTLYLRGLKLPEGIRKLHAEDITNLWVCNPVETQYGKSSENYVIVPEGAGEEVIRPLIESDIEYVYLMDTEMPDYVIRTEEDDYGYIETINGDENTTVYVYSADGEKPGDCEYYWYYDSNMRPIRSRNY